ncbi:unnamed protein product [Pedinophyceae sp. YPF-701]|nr:unnamed protein product [Pedinophyceae sp. YPF-701]
MKVVSLFSGIGGLDLGLEQAGHEIILQCENFPDAQAVLQAHFPSAVLVPDIRQLRTLPKETECVAAGFPCIDVSVNGLRRGLQGPSSGLVAHVFRLLRDAKDRNRPVPWVLLENVEGLLSPTKDAGGALMPPPVQTIVSEFEAIGYSSWAQRIICSQAFGLPQRRRRVFILAAFHADARDVLLTGGQLMCAGACHDRLSTTDLRQPCYRCWEPDADPNTHAFAFDLGEARSLPSVECAPTMTSKYRALVVLLQNQYGMLRVADAERLQGLPENWTRVEVPRGAAGVASPSAQSLTPNADGSRPSVWTMIANAVTVPVARWIGEKLAPGMLHASKYVGGRDDVPLATCMQREVPLAPDGAARDQGRGQRAVALQPGASWPDAAWWVVGQGRHVAAAGDSPVLVPFTPLSKFIKGVGLPPGPGRVSTYLNRLLERGWPKVRVDALRRRFMRAGARNLELDGEADCLDGRSYVPRVRDGVERADRVAEEPLSGARLESAVQDRVQDVIAATVADQADFGGRGGVGGVEGSSDDDDPMGGGPTEDDGPGTGGVPVECEEVFGTYYPLTDLIRCEAPCCAGKGLAPNSGPRDGMFSGTEWLTHAGSQKKNWRSILVISGRGVPFVDPAAPNVTIATWFKRAAEDRRRRQRKEGAAKRPRQTGLTIPRTMQKEPCGVCSSCMERGGNRLCLSIRAFRAAQSGHAGGMLASMREGAIGATVEVFWPLDEKFYQGHVIQFDPYKCQHMIKYVDGDVEQIPLWSPMQNIRITTPPGDWPAKRLQLQHSSDVLALISRSVPPHGAATPRTDTPPAGAAADTPATVVVPVVAVEPAAIPGNAPAGCGVPAAAAPGMETPAAPA